MADRINFLNKINDSVQVGDELYWTFISAGVAAPTPLLVGTITGIGEKYVEVADGDAPSPFQQDAMFFMFKKPAHNNYTNTSSLKGYYAEVTFSNNSDSKQELFAIGSEVTESSK